MTLTSGQFLGPYEIIASLGAGGMGEVYRARDSRLGRDVAIKVIAARLAGDSERLRRFEQEARAASALNHPNLLTVFDIGTHTDMPYLVTELLEGATLREKIREGPLSLRRTIEFANQLARGLAAAHERRIIHRDLKPENVFITQDGRVKILDFGLAKLLPQQFPTTQITEAATATAGTGPGIVMGTVGYMSPEQVRGENADHRSDLFAVGCILYEMVSGKKTFQRQTAPETMTAILKEDPVNLSELKPDLPPAFVRLVEHCLAKRPEDRSQTATDLAFALENVSGSSTSSWAAVPASPVRPAWRSPFWMASIFLALLTALIGVIWMNRSSTPLQEAATPVRIALALPPEEHLGPLHIPAFSLSPDGTQLAYTANLGGVQQLFLRQLDTLQGKPLPGTQGAHGSPFFSPDGKWIGFFSRGKLRKIATSGGEAIALTDVPYG
jgi:serine/threonine protein kinase